MGSEMCIRDSIERHKNTHHIGIGYIKGYGLKSGAVATSISHDSHNIIVVGTNEEDIAAAANRVVELGGGIVVMGSEGNGISSGTARCVTRRLFIPPYPGAAPTSESLNVAMATAVVAAEFRRRIR